MSKSSWIALLLALGLALGGCKSGDDDDAAGDDDDSGDYNPWDDDADWQAVLDTFEPSVVTLGETPHFVAEGSFCSDEDTISFYDEDTQEYVYVEHYTVREYERIEGTIPADLWVAIYNVWVDCSHGWADGLENGLEVVPEDPGDDDDSA